MPITTNLTTKVDLTTRARGAEYFRTRRVRISDFSPQFVGAEVQGSRLYDVDITLEEATLRAACTCPYVARSALACKHIWATLLAAELRGFGASILVPVKLAIDRGLDAEDEDEEEDPDADPYGVYSQNRSRYAPPPPPPPPPPPQVTWKNHLATLAQSLQPIAPTHYERTPPSDLQFLFVVDAQSSHESKKLVLELMTQHRKKSGDWGKAKGQPLTTGVTRNLVDPLDRQVLSLLGGADGINAYNQTHYSYYSHSGPYRFRVEEVLLDTVLPLLIESGRFRLRRETKNAELELVVADLDPPWDLVVDVAANEKGSHWVLSGRLRRGEELMPLSKPAVIVPGFVFYEGRISRLNDAGAFGWIPSLRSLGSIPVPTTSTDEFLVQLFQMPQLPSLSLPEELRYEELRVPPKRVLVVKSVKDNYGGQQLQGDLSFEYDGLRIVSEAPGRGILRPVAKQFLLRDSSLEKAASQRLFQLGFHHAWTTGKRVLQLRPSSLPKVVRELVGEGWLVEAEGKLYRQAGSFQLSVRTTRDWFDLSATANFDGLPVAMPQLLAALRRGDSSIVLDDGSLGMVPEDWLKQYGLIARMGTVEGDQLRFGRAQLGVLDALLASRPEIEFDKQFAQARGALAKFDGIDPADPPKGFKGELRGYQREGLGWLRFLRKFGFGGCLADDMGLGKTVQVLALLAGKRNGPALIVVPRSLIFNWKREAARFAPKLKVLEHHGTTRDRTGATFKDFDLVLTTYGTLRNDAAAFTEIRFDTCVLDESQAAKNADTETAKAVRLVQADHRLALSGTPIENHLGELWTLFDFLNPGMLGRASAFGGESSPSRNPDPETRAFLAKALRPYLLRRTKDQVAKDLPQKTEQTIYCDLEPEQRKLYDELRDHYRQSLLSRIDSVGLGRSKIQVLEALLRLRQAACHPGLIDKSRKKETSAKLEVLLPQLKEVLEEGHKALVFSQFTSLLDIVRSRLDADGVTYEYLDGKTRDREERVERFQTDPECKLFLVSLKAGGVGLNLTAAEYVFLLDPWWNPAVEAQAIDRTHRIGQTRPVFAYRLIAKGTVEEKVLALQESKRELADAILGGDNRLITDLKREDLELLLS